MSIYHVVLVTHSRRSEEEFEVIASTLYLEIGLTLCENLHLNEDIGTEYSRSFLVKSELDRVMLFNHSEESAICVYDADGKRLDV